MGRQDYRYVAEFLREDGSSAGQAPVCVDWGPAEESARLAAVRRSAGLHHEMPLGSTVEPVWHEELGEPYVGGFRLRLGWNADVEDGGPHPAVEFPSAYFAEAATRLAKQLEAEGRLEAGEARLHRVTAFPAEPSAPDDRVEDRAVSAYTLLERSMSSLAAAVRREGPHHDEDVRAFVPQSVLDEITILSRDAGDEETGGILIGHLHRDPTTGEMFVRVTAQIPARHTEATSTSLTFTGETWSQVRAARRLRGQEEIMLGWWHSHPFRAWCKDCPEEKRKVCPLVGPFFSAEDRHVHRTVFPRAESLALVVSQLTEDRAAVSMFGWRLGAIAERGFDVIDVTHATPAEVES